MDENLERGARDLHRIDELSNSGDREMPISPDRLLSAVADEHRRAILNSLTSASDKTLTRDALVDRVANRVRDEDGARASREHRQRVRLALHHTHLPKLEAVRLIDYETETGLVQFVGGELPQELLRVVEPYDTSE